MDKKVRGKTFIVAGPSGVGKGTILKKLFETHDLYYSVSATTRDPREGEVDGVHYHFLSVEEFRAMIAEDALLEHAEYAGNYYGTPKRYVDEAMDAGRDVILEIEMQGARQVCAKRPETIRIFIAPPSWEELERRLVNRGTDAPEKIAQRLRQARVELENAGEYDYMVVNETVEKAAEEVAAILCAEHCRVDGRLEEILKK
ncbi:MAG: guanylate kinase [Oscillospiraceae bacterium]|nr:guanylate kinase [Oscillospiraceae bacterium]